MRRLASLSCQRAFWKQKVYKLLTQKPALLHVSGYAPMVASNPCLNI
jgi:hypothetical protein